MPSILRKQLVCALAYQLFLHFLVRLVVKYHTFKDDLLWFYTFLRTFFVVFQKKSVSFAAPQKVDTERWKTDGK